MKRLLWVSTYIVGLAITDGVLLAIWLHFYPSRGNVALYLTSGVQFALIPALTAIVIFAGLRRWVYAPQSRSWRPRRWSTPRSRSWSRRMRPTVSGSAWCRRTFCSAARTSTRSSSSSPPPMPIWSPCRRSLHKRCNGFGTERSLGNPHEFAEPAANATGTALFSRKPLTDTSVVPDTALRNLQARTDLPGAPGTQVFAMHPAAPLWSNKDHWFHDMGVLAGHLAALPQGRVLAIGDFNSTWNHATYRKLLTNGLADGTDLAGAGYLPTYPTDKQIGNHPLVAIDRIIVRGFVTTSMDTHHVPGSDHRALVVSLVAS